MPSVRSMTGSGRRMLVRHLTRLSDTLESFGARLRDAVSSAVGQTVAGVVRESVRALLADPPADSAPSRRFAQPARRPLWSRQEHPDDEPWYDDPDD